MLIAEFRILISVWASEDLRIQVLVDMATGDSNLESADLTLSVLALVTCSLLSTY